MTPEETALLAVKEFNRLAPTLTSFASALAGRKLFVRAGVSTYTDGSTIYIRPPDLLATRAAHDYSLCDKRENFKLLCPGCERIENIYYRLQHEMAHCIFNSLKPVNVDMRDFVKAAGFGTQEFIDSITDVCNLYTGHIKDTPPKIARIFGNHVGMMNNFMEDYRIERNTGMLRAGFSVMSYYQLEDVIENGIPGDEHNNYQTQRWQDTEPDQLIKALWLFNAQGHQIDNRFDSKMVADIHDFSAVFSKDKLQSVTDSILGAVSFVAFMNVRGYFQDNPDEQNASNEQNQEGQDSRDGEEAGQNQSQGQTGQTQADQTQADQTQADQTQADQAQADQAQTDQAQADQAQADQAQTDQAQTDQTQNQDNKSKARKLDGNKLLEIFTNKCGISHDHNAEDFEDDQTGSGIPDDLLAKVINQSENWDEYEENLSGLKFLKKTDNSLKVFRTKSINKPSLSTTGPSVLHARRIFSDSKLDKNEYGLKRGKLNSNSLARRAWNDDPRLFKKKTRAEGISSEVCIGLDISGSTEDTDNSGLSFCSKIAQLGYGLSDLLNKVGVDFSIFAHTTSHYNNGLAQYIIAIKDVNDRWDNASKDRCLSLVPLGGSLDGHNFEFYRKKLQASKANRKLMIYFTDGQIPATRRQDEIPVLQREIKTLKKLGIATLGVGIYTDAPKEVGMDTVLLRDHTDMSTVLKEVEKRIINVSLQ